MKNANPVSFPLRIMVLVTALALTAGCGRGDSPREPVVRKTAADFFVIPLGGTPVRLQLAVRPREMERGLMERRDLKRDEGMIFIYERPRQMSFWMRNTPTPLDIGFFSADGVLKEIHPMYPYDERSVPSRSDRIQFAVELNQGWFVRNEVKPGAKLDLEALAAAMEARGFDPKKYGIK